MANCPPESYWDPEQRRLLSRAERSLIQRHCVRCEVCRMREDRLPLYDGIPARVASGVAAAVLLTGLLYLPESRPIVDETAGLPVTPVLRTVEPAAPEPVVAAAGEDEPSVIPDRPVVRRARPAPQRIVASLEPSRTFVPPPQGKVHRADPVRLDPPPQLSVARLEQPVIPADPPNLQPPRRHPLKRLVSVLAVPFRHI